MYFWPGEFFAACDASCQLLFCKDHGDKGNIEMCFPLSAGKKNTLGWEPGLGREQGGMVWESQLGVVSYSHPASSGYQPRGPHITDKESDGPPLLGRSVQAPDLPSSEYPGS